MIFTLPIWIATNQCISPLELDQKAPEDILIVEGFIDDDFGPHEIEVSLLSLFAGVTEGGERRRVVADVRIVDDLGSAVRLIREEFVRVELVALPGCNPFINMQPSATNYLTPEDFRGEAGRSYSLEVELDDGRLYKSVPEQLPERTEIDSLFVSFNRFPGETAEEDRTGVDVFAVWEDDPTTDDYHFWRVGGVYRIETPNIPGLCCIYDPRDGLADECWVVEQNLTSDYEAFEDRLANGESVVRKVTFIEDDGLRFASSRLLPTEQYYVEVDQFTISESAFEYFQRVETLSEINGEIFDPPPVGAVGNIISVDNPTETVVGFFGAYSKDTEGLFVSRDQLDFVKKRSICGDCRAFYGGQLETPEPYQ